MKKLSEFKDDDILAFIGSVNGYTYIVQRKYSDFDIYGGKCFKKSSSFTYIQRFSIKIM